MRDLLRFLKAWRKAAAAADSSVFRGIQQCGLCHNALLYDRKHKTRAYWQLHQRLRDEFAESQACPFHSDYSAYEREANDEVQHLNPVRRAWVDATIAELSAKIKGR